MDVPLGAGHSTITYYQHIISLWTIGQISETCDICAILITIFPILCRYDEVMCNYFLYVLNGLIKKLLWSMAGQNIGRCEN